MEQLVLALVWGVLPGTQPRCKGSVFLGFSLFLVMISGLQIVLEVLAPSGDLCGVYLLLVPLLCVAPKG